MSPRTPDLAIVTQDPRFLGGALAQLLGFADTARALGRVPSVMYGRRPPLGGPAPVPTGDLLEARSRVARIDALGIPRTASRLVPAVRSASSVWVVATIAFYGLAALRAGRRYGCWIGTTYDGEQEGRRGGLDAARRVSASVNGVALRRWERNVLQGATVVLATTTHTADGLARVAGLNRESIAVLPIPIDTGRFVPLPDDDWSSLPPTISFVGRADDPRKNVGLLIAAFERARQVIPDLRLEIIGRPPEGEVPAGVDVVGAVPHVAPYLRASHLLVIPSLQEGFGIVAAEALASGVPVITTPSGGPEETVRQSGGGHVLSGFEVEELSDAIVALLTDDSRLAEMRAEGRRHVVASHGLNRFRAMLEVAMADLDRAG